MTQWHTYDAGKYPRDVMHILIPQRVRHRHQALPARIQQSTGVGHFQRDKFINRRPATERPIGFSKIKTRQFKLRDQLATEAQPIEGPVPLPIG
jgi:hypothetical protein